MADVRLAVEKVGRAGLSGATYTGSLSAANTYQVRNNGRVVLHLKKSAAVDCVVTIPTPGTKDGLAIADQTVTVPATTGDVFISGLVPALFNDSNGDLNITFSDVDGLTIAVLGM